MKALLGIFCCVALLGMSLENEWEESKKRGKEIYESVCIACHMGEGEGIEGVFPPLAKADYLMENPDKAARAIKYGQMGEIIVNGVTYNNIMPDPGLDEQEIADVMNYIMSAWGNEAEEMITVDFVKAVEEE